MFKKRDKVVLKPLAEIEIQYKKHKDLMEFEHDYYNAKMLEAAYEVYEVDTRGCYPIRCNSTTVGTKRFKPYELEHVDKFISLKELYNA